MKVLTSALVVGVVAGGCNGSSTIGVRNTDPNVTVAEPGNGEIYYEGQEILFRVEVNDNEDYNDQLQYVWSIAPDGDFDGTEDYTDTDATLTLPGGLMPGDHTLTLEVIDRNGASGTDSVDISVLTNLDPTLTFVAPIEGGTYPAQLPLQIIATATDDDEAQPVEDLVLVWGGLAAAETFAPAHPDAAGGISFYVSELTPGLGQLVSVQVSDLATTIVRSIVVNIVDGDLDADGHLDVGLGGDDCDDDDETSHPGAEEVCDGADNDCDDETDEDSAVDAPTWHPDADEDHFGDPSVAVVSCAPPEAGYISVADDCDDLDNDINPDADELCDEEDNDCDGLIDEDDAVDSLTWFADDDLDGFGDPDSTTSACTQPSGYVDSDTDCDDHDNDLNPDADEICDSADEDEDCDGLTDDDDDSTIEKTAYYEDDDEDGAGDEDGVSQEWCDAPAGLVANNDDCDDSDPDLSPSSAELCDEIDNDCNGVIDDESALPYQWWYEDNDEDGYGDPDDAFYACAQPEETVANDLDCDDGDDDTNPDATEMCDGDDNDCDGLTDEEDAADAIEFYADDDGDGYGDADDTSYACSLPEDHASNDIDCDDHDDDVYPGADETWYDGEDSDCAGDSDFDQDGDGEDALGYGGLDCLDEDPDSYPGAEETWYDGIDSDCDGASDYDKDLDGYERSEDGGLDCDDDDDDVNPDSADTWYDGVDSDCDGASDYDKDQDGSDWVEYGGRDCDDGDDTSFDDAGVFCRPLGGCDVPDAATLELVVPVDATDLVFDSSCLALVGTVDGGADHVHAFDADGTEVATLDGHASYDMGAVALDPSTNAVVVGYQSGPALGVEDGGDLPSVRVTSKGGSSGNWSAVDLRPTPASIAVDSSGCVWFPNWGGSGYLQCIYTSGTTGPTPFAWGPSNHIETVALGNVVDGYLYVSTGGELFRTEPYAADDGGSAYFTTSSAILDAVVDYNEDIYLEADGEIWHVPGDGSAATVLDTVVGEGKLAITPDGRLMRIVPNPGVSVTFEEWDLPE